MIRFLLFCAVSILALIFGWFVYENSRPLDPRVLAERAAASLPHWATYQEDIKGQIGAKAVAQWQGRPVRAHQEGRVVQVEFEIDGSWETYRAAMPILARDPFGNEVRDIRAAVEGARVTYAFEFGVDSGPGVIPWIELQFPHNDQRITFAPDGTWKSRT